ncbi:unnamed protein product, partial [Mesorhabditis belari]|uniref:EGF-like domain-containing protein n=1 Tax=Mesorhabditis belari TaxID=2138241 RepID=A0AAF3ETT4_9BILA
MRAWLALIVLGIGTSIGKEIALNLPCNNELDGLLAQDPEGNESAFLQCVAVDGVNGIGFWERKFCPNNMIFDFVGQQCKDDDKKHHYRKEANKFNIAILNNSCARGEQCIGGTVCDLETLRCLCPYGTQADLDTLSCITPGMPNQFSTFTGFKPQPSQFGSNTGGNIEVGFLPNPGQPQPPQQSQLPFNFNFNMNKNGMSPETPSGFPSGLPDFLMPSSQNSGIDFKPNPFMVPPMSKKIPILAPPGKSCKEGELCTGGSLCTRPIGMCLCPGDLEERQGECVLPERAAIIITKVGIGAICGDLAECDHGSTCVNGRCMCVAPLLQEDGRCIMQPQHKEVGPGELCDNGEVCVKGSVCDSVIPVCVCPADTDLRDGECVRIKSNFIRPLPAVAPWATPTPQYQTQPPSSAIPLVPVEPYHPPQPIQPIPSLPPIQPISNVQRPTQPPQPERPTYPLPNFQTQPPNIITTPRPIPAYKTAPPNYVGPQSYRAINTPPSQSVKQNIIKLGGSKQAGVGVRCSLNTDCMVGAYCNGNTNPPSCQCLSTHVNVDGKCEKVIYPGQIGCLNDAQCTSAYTGTKCIDRICVCPQGKKAVDQTCVPGNTTKCELTAECPPSFHCVHNQCICPSTTIAIASKCVSPTNINCLSDSNCPKSMQCGFNNICECPMKGVFLHGKCWSNSEAREKRSLKQRREAQVDSSMVCWPGASTCAGHRGICINDICHCLEGFLEKSGHCVENRIPLGGNCEGDGENLCTSPLECVDGSCTCTLAIGCSKKPNPQQDSPAKQNCPPGTVFKRGRCVDVPGAFVSLNAACSSQDRCSSGSLCVNGVCKCIDGATERNGRCHQYPGGRCSNGEACDGDATCELGICKCAYGFTLKDDQCIAAVAQPGASCQLGQVCTQGSKCRFGICMCVGKTYLTDKKCVEKGIVLINQKKEVTKMKTSPMTVTRTLLTTITPISSTPLRFSHRKDKDFERGPGQICEVPKHRCIKGSICVEGFCICMENEVIINGECVSSEKQAIEIINQIQISAPGQPCNNQSECVGGSSCVKEICTCPPEMIISLGACADDPAKQKASSTPGMLCVTSIECPLRTECLRNVCRCKPGETVVENSCQEAINQVLPGGQCKKGYDCVGESQCRFGVCTCGAKLVSDGKECVSIESLSQVQPGNSCDNSTICMGGSICLENLCTCPPEYIEDAKKCVLRSITVYHKYAGNEAQNEIVDLTGAPLINQAMPRFAYLPTLGENCETLCRDGASCIQHYCQCVGEFFEYTGKCIHKSEADALFNSQVHSISYNFLPANASSDLARNYGINLEGVPNILLGHKCTHPTDCPANAFCFGQACRCLYGFRATAGYCEVVIPLGGECVSGNQCEGDATCVDGICTCVKPETKRCRPAKLARPGDNCMRNQVCSYNSFCSTISGVCECPPGMETIDDRCIQTDQPRGRFCLSSRSCHKFSYCDNGSCVCKNSYVLANGFCVPQPGRISNEELFDLVRQSYYSYKGQAFSGYGQDFMPFTRSDSSWAQARIRAELDRSTVNQEAEERKAKFPTISTNPSTSYLSTLPSTIPTISPVQTMAIPSFPFLAVNVPNKNNNLPPFTFTAENLKQGGTPVQVNVIPPSYQIQIPTSNQRLTFNRPPNIDAYLNPNPNYIEKPANVEEPDKVLGSPEDTETENTTSSMKKLAQPGEFCGDEFECAGNSYCDHDFCRCPRGSKSMNGFCTRRKHMLPSIYNEKVDAVNAEEQKQFSNPLESCENGEFCTAGSECSAISGLGKLCQCPDTHFVLDSECVQFPKNALASGVGQSCAKGELCLGGSKCRGKICLCLDGTEELFGICIKKASPGDSCSNGEICMEGSTCKRNHCLCPIGTISFKSKCIVERVEGLPGTPCTTDRACSEDSYCSDHNICECPPFHINFGKNCIREEVLKSPNEGCNHLSICTNGTTCEDGSTAPFAVLQKIRVLVNEVVTSPPGGSCSGERECTGGSICREGWCVCPHHTMIVQKGICVQTQPRPTIPPRPSPPLPATTPRTFPTYPTAPPQTQPPISQTQPPSPRQPIVLGRKATPGAQCGPLDTCVGGSMCVEGFCLCPAGSQASELGRCLPATTIPASTSPPIKLPTQPTLGGILRVRPTQPAQPPPVFASLPPRRPAASIEVPLTPSASNLVSPTPTTPTTTFTSNEKEDDSECRAIGLICKGNTVCRNKSCQCPDGHVLLGDACVLPETEKKAARRGKSWSQAQNSKYARPMEDCSHGEQCVGGAECAALSDGTTRCICPIEKPVPKGDWCVAEEPQKKIGFPGGACDENTVCARGSTCQNGFCRCPVGQISIAGMCTTPPPAPQPTTPSAPVPSAPIVLRKRANPFDSCEEGEICTGGSSCDEDTGRCMCPIGMIVMMNECKSPPTTAKTPVIKSAECQNDAECGANRVCVVGACKCRPGFVDNAGKCEPLEAVEFNERPAPVSYAKHKVQSLAREEEVSAEEAATRPTPRPRVKGLPIRRPKPKPKPKSGGSSGGGGGSGMSSRKTSNGEGFCPPGNEPTRDEESGKIIVCNGIEPNCPPRSYCYITSAFTRAPLVYGHPCIEGVDKCRNGASCIDHVCKCSPGEMLNASAHCTPITRAPLHFPPTTTESYFLPYTAPTTPRVPIVRIETISPKTPDVVSWMKPKPDQFSSMPSKEVAIGGSCTLFDDCLRGSECIESVCQCPPTTNLEDAECVKEHRRDIAFPGDSCALGQLCAGGSICDNDSSKCICGAGFIKMGRRCNNKDGPRFAAPGDRCGRGEECSGGSYCEKRKCVCDAQHYSSSGYCRPIGSPNSDVRLDGNGLRFSSKQIPPRPRAQECNPFECRLPECFCSRSGKEPPAGLQPEQIPQFIVLTFDDSVNGRTLSDYKKIFDSDRWFNPNGCPVRGTFFISHEWTNYDAVQWIHRRGHEIASNSITHTSLENEDSRRWLGEMDGMRRMLSKFGGADEAEVVGMRAPQLATGGDAQFEMMMRAGFLYDNTMTANPGLDSPPYWPQTMDYKVSFACNDNKCPDRSFPGIWEIPINQFYGGYMKQIDSHRRASMLRAATHLDASMNELVDMLMTNFERAYHSNRAPYVLTLNADFLQLNNTDIGMRSFVRFMDEISKNKDVYFVTLEQLVKWMQRPTTLQEAPQSEALRCRRAFSDLSKATCAKPNKCMYRTPDLTSPEHQFLTCAPCPDVYPWLENPVGTT